MEDDLYQFEVKHLGQLSLKVDGRSLYDEKQKDRRGTMFPSPCRAAIIISNCRSNGGQPAGLEIRFGGGGTGTTDLDGKQFRHPGAK